MMKTSCRIRYSVKSLLFATMILIAVSFCHSIIIQAATFSPRLSAPAANSPYYSNGAYNPFVSAVGTLSDVPNCTTYAWGRAYEILGTRPPLPTGNAGAWYGAASNKGPTPKLGAIACWGGGTYGHVAVVEVINGNEITLSQSSYDPRNYWFTEQKNVNNMGSGFQGYIYIGDYNTQPTQGSPIGGGSQTISNGDYHIVSALNNSMGVDVAGNGNSDGTNVQLYTNVSDPNQVFNIQYLNNGFYKITHKNSGRVLDVYGGGLDYNTNVSVYGYNGTDAQLWRIDESGDGKYFYIKAKCNGLCLDVNNGEATNGSNIKVYGGNESNAQKWAFVAVSGSQTISDGDYHIVSGLNNKMGLDVAGNGNADDTNVQLYTNTDDAKQVFTVKYLGNGYYKLLHKGSGKSLDLHGNSSVANTNISIYRWNNSDAQKWIIRSAGNGYYNIICKGSGLYVDVNNGEAIDGSNVKGYIGNGTNAQKWKFEHAHNMTRVAAKEATTSSEGNIEYWKCSSCGSLFKDSSGKDKISIFETVIPKKEETSGSKGGSETGGGSQTRGGRETGGGEQTGDGSQTIESSPVEVKEPITINKTPAFVKVKAKKNRITVTWKKIKKTKKTKKLLSQIKGIQVQYSTDAKFKQNPVAKKIGKNKTKIVLKLKKKTIYYVRVRYVGKDGYSKWSKTRKLKTKK